MICYDQLIIDSYSRNYLHVWHRGRHQDRDPSKLEKKRVLKFSTIDRDPGPAPMPTQVQ